MKKNYKEYIFHQVKLAENKSFIMKHKLIRFLIIFFIIFSIFLHLTKKKFNG